MSSGARSAYSVVSTPSCWSRNASMVPEIPDPMIATLVTTHLPVLYSLR